MRRIPRLPESVPSALGPVTVERVSKAVLASDGVPAYGDWEWHRRTIRVWDGLAGWPMRQVFWHEWTHMVLSDAGVASEMPNVVLEMVCDAVANAKVHAERAGHGAAADV